MHVICLAGPTGCGKTALAIRLALEFDGEIVNADSRQVYADIPIITAQPDAGEMAAAAHHLYGYMDPALRIDAGQWLASARAACEDIAARGKIPIVTGGTGFYFEALLHGIAAIPPVPPQVRKDIAARLAAEGVESLHAYLARVDPVYAAKIHRHDKQRVCRALEVYAASGKSFSYWHARGGQEPAASGPLLAIGINLTRLEPLLARRIDAMLAHGAMAEAACAAARHGAAAPGLRCIGAAELLAHMAGQFDLTQAKRLWLAATRAYAKRQLTWFRGRKEAQWIEAGDWDGAAALARSSLDRAIV